MESNDLHAPIHGGCLCGSIRYGIAFPEGSQFPPDVTQVARPVLSVQKSWENPRQKLEFTLDFEALKSGQNL